MRNERTASMPEDVKELVAEWTTAAEGVTQNWRLAPHYNVGWRGVAKEPSPNKWQGVYEPIPGQDLGSRSGIVTVGIKGAEVDDCWLYIKEPDARWLERCSPSGIRTLLDALSTLSAKVEELTRERDEARRSLVAAWNAFGPSTKRGDPPAFSVDDLDHLPRSAYGDLDAQIVALEDRAEAAEASLAERVRIIAEKGLEQLRDWIWAEIEKLPEGASSLPAFDHVLNQIDLMTSALEPAPAQEAVAGRCCSSISPCAHQRNDPTTICETCARATSSVPAAPADTSKGGR